jgi:hypothetical protein
MKTRVAMDKNSCNKRPQKPASFCSSEPAFVAAVAGFVASRTNAAFLCQAREVFSRSTLL